MTISTPADLAQPRLDLLRAHLADQVTPAGVVHCACRSRVLESVLAYELLTRESEYPEALSRVSTYLDGIRQSGDLTLMDQTLLGIADTDPLAEFDHHTSPRKRVLIDTVRYLVGTRDHVPDPLPADGGTHSHTWKQVELLACHVIRHHGTGQDVSQAELQSLARQVSADHIVEDVRLSHLLCLHALRPYPAYRAAFEHGLALLVATQCQDGGFAPVAHLDIWLTSVVGTALSEAGADPEVLTRIGDFLSANQSADGSWSFAPGIEQTDVDSAYTALATLHHNPDRYAEPITAGHRYIRRMQNSDGGWPTYRHGSPSEAAMTGGALAVLADRAYDHAEAIAAGALWLAEAQHADGTFERGWSLAEGNAIFRAVHGLCAAKEKLVLPAATSVVVQRALDRATGYLTNTQNTDGGWGHRAGSPSDPVSTAYALAALGRLEHREPIPAALGYLACQQEPQDGGFTGPADTVAPRPIPLDIPLFVSAYVLRGLAYSTQ